MTKMRINLDSTPFPHFDSRYKCCCNAVHVKQGSLMVAVISFVMLVFAFFAQLFNHDEDVAVKFGQMSLSIVELITIVALVYGLHTEREIFLLPFMIIQLIGILFLALSILTAIAAFLAPHSYAATLLDAEFMLSSRNETLATTNSSNLLDNNDSNISNESLVQLAAIFAIITFGLAAILTAWWLMVVYRCYRYLRELNGERAKCTNSIHYNVRTENA